MKNLIHQAGFRLFQARQFLPRKGLARLRLFVLLLLVCNICFVARAKPFYPMLSKPAMDSLRAELWHTPPSIARVEHLLNLTTAVVSRYPVTDVPLDSVYRYTQQARSLSKKLHYVAGQIQSNYLLGWFLINSDQPQEAEKLIRQSIERSRRQHDFFLEGMGWGYLAGSVDRSPAGETQRLAYYAQALRCYRRLHDQEWEAYILKEVADVHIRQGKHAIAQGELQQVVALYRACAPSRLHFTFDLLAVTNSALANYKEALRYSLASIRSAKETGDTLLLSAFYHRASGLYQELNQPVSALDYAKLALYSSHKAGYPPYYSLESALNIAKKLIVLGQPEQALSQLLKERQSYPTTDNFSRLLETEGLTACYLALKKYSLAAKHSKVLLSLF
jgi:tetratricopeptide (TPR) repeat protein